MTSAAPALVTPAEVVADKAEAMPLRGAQLGAVESLRGVAALMVLCYHLAELLKLPIPDSLGVLRTHFGLGVPLFYTLSGFVLAFGYADKLFSRGEVMAYYVRRFFRIAPLFYALLLVWLALNWFLWNKTVSSQTLFLNLSFLFGLVPGAQESVVWAGWSIGIEMLFYAVFPIAILLVRGVVSGCIAFLVSCVLSAAVFNAFSAAGLTGYAYMNLATHLPFFVAGVLAFRAWQKLAPARGAVLRLPLLLGAIAISLLLVSSDAAYLALVGLRFGAAERNVWALVFGVLILSVCMGSSSVLERGPLRSLGKVSFSIYLTHPVVMLVLIQTRAVEALTSRLPGPNAVFFVGAMVTVALVWAVSAVTFRWIETPGVALGRDIANRVRNADAGASRHPREATSI